MPFQLILMRHAKSDHDDPRLADHDRPLSPRGIQDAPRMATWLQQANRVPELILCSTATRTRQTAELMLKEWPDSSTSVVHCEKLYLSSPETMFWTLRTEHQKANRLMVLAHNPGISTLSSVLSGRSLAMPTAAITIFDLHQDAATETDEHPFEKLSSETPLRQTHFVSPKSLPH